MSNELDSLIDALLADPGLTKSVSKSDLNGGIAAAKTLNDVLMTAIDKTHANDDGIITPGEMQKISDAVFNDPAQWQKFILAHGNDNGTVETGFHLLQSDGGTLVFQGRSLVDTVIDSIYHFGFEIVDGRYVNEDGATNETVADVAGWLNYFLNGVNIVFGGNAKDVLGSGEYSSEFADARNETFYAYGGNDEIWADVGNDTIYGGDGADKSGGGDGNDRMYGEAGKDVFWGDKGNDAIYGGSGADQLGGSAGADSLYGDSGNDTLSGNENNDKLFGGDGSDTLSGDAGADVIRGDKGKDEISLWEDVAAKDTIVFAPGDSGKTSTTIDVVNGFVSGQDKINLSAFGHMTFEQLDYSGGGKSSFYYDGHYLRIDSDGNGTTDMMIQFMWVDSFKASDFILA